MDNIKTIIDDLHEVWEGLVREGTMTMEELIASMLDPRNTYIRGEEYCEHHAELLGWDSDPKNVTEVQWHTWDGIVGLAEGLFIQHHN